MKSDVIIQMESKYLHYLNTVKQKIAHEKPFTNKQYSEIFSVSERTFSDFINGKIIRFDLLFEYATMHEFTIDIKLIDLSN